MSALTVSLANALNEIARGLSASMTSQAEHHITRSPEQVLEIAIEALSDLPPSVELQMDYPIETVHPKTRAEWSTLAREGLPVMASA